MDDGGEGVSVYKKRESYVVLPHPAGTRSSLSAGPWLLPLSLMPLLPKLLGRRGTRAWGKEQMKESSSLSEGQGIPFLLLKPELQCCSPSILMPTLGFSLCGVEASGFWRKDK